MMDDVEANLLMEPACFLEGRVQPKHVMKAKASPI
jgi:hypothetical protein